MTNAETAAFFRHQSDHHADMGNIALADDYKLAAESLEAVERLDAERDQWQSIGAEEGLRRLAADWRRLGRERTILARELDAEADKIKARREAADEAD